MLELKDNNGILLPQEVQDRVNNFIDNLQKIPWLKPSKELKKEEVDKQAKFTLECFWVKAEIEYKSLKTEKDWDSAWASAWDSAWDSARDSARASAEILIEWIDCEFNKKYPNWAFRQLLKLWEMGVYPVWVLKDTKTFVIYIPPCSIEFPKEFV